MAPIPGGPPGPPSLPAGPAADCDNIVEQCRLQTADISVGHLPTSDSVSTQMHTDCCYQAAAAPKGRKSLPSTLHTLHPRNQI